MFPFHVVGLIEAATVRILAFKKEAASKSQQNADRPESLTGSDVSRLMRKDAHLV
jgi:hypothetical protein